MKVPASDRRTALLVVDIQPAFVNDRIAYIVSNCQKLLGSRNYEFIAAGHIYAEADSLWAKQHGWTASPDGNLLTVEPLGSRLKELGAVSIKKTTRSLFKGDPSLSELLLSAQIEEVHIVGLDTYDCVTATAHEAFDLGFFTYVIEECCQCTSGQELHDRAVENLRFVNLTNNSCREQIPVDDVDLGG